MRHEGTAGGDIVEMRKIVALLRRVLRSAKQTRPRKAKPIYYLALVRVIVIVLCRSETRCRA